MIIDLDNLGATIRLFKPAINLEEIRPKPLLPRHHAYKGEISRIVLESVWRSQRPLTAQEIAQHVMAEASMQHVPNRSLIGLYSAVRLDALDNGGNGLIF